MISDQFYTHCTWLVDNIRKEMAQCRDAIREGKWAELATIVHRIAAKARRVVKVAKTKAGSGSLEAAVERTERGTHTGQL